ncbi:XrtA/PEP-CTERM system histidine kinase PrsK [Sphingomonas sp. FW199]|uniref:XrtA/PEP-CTERM system histidine kinase PrsK n=1 Tax=Sphingomonas sp. FW199 TaxID=3400217 RepID=UPI003CEBA6BE
MMAAIILWGHASAAVLFAALALATLRRPVPGVPRPALVAALALTALWALAVAGVGPVELGTRLAAGARGMAWLLLAALVHRLALTRPPAALGLVYLVVLLIQGTQMMVALAATAASPATADAYLNASAALNLMVSVAALVLLLNGYRAATMGRGRAVIAAASVLWLIEANGALLHLAAGGVSDELLAARGIAMGMIAAALALSLIARTDRRVQVSRTALMQSLWLLGAIVYLTLLLSALSLIAVLGGDHARLGQAAFVFGTTAATLVFLSSPWLRAWVRVKLAKHLFRHRYDYRVEWQRFTETLGQPDSGATLDERVVKAVADLVDAPAGLLLLPAGDGLSVASGWRWSLPVVDPASMIVPADTHERIVELDAVRRTGSDPSVPAWILAESDAWIIVPLPHVGTLAGAILLARPPLDRALDWEDFDLLRVAGRQAASYLAEARAQDALAEARRFDEFNRRFAFILHDIKNLVSQLSLVARNAERHADNPEFRADMIATLRDSAGRMTDLIARLSHQQRGGGAEAMGAVSLRPVIDAVIARRPGQPIVLDGDSHPVALADPQRLEQLLAHLVQNAVEASAPGTPVTMRLGEAQDHVWIDVIDSGAGMTAAFIRDSLFRPFVSSKPTGFGIGAFEARQLVEAMGGRIDVDSTPGIGSRFRVRLARADAVPAAITDTPSMEKAA